MLADVLGALAVRRLGAWAVLIGLADLSEAAWRKRLRTCHAWLLWVLRELVAAPAPPARLSAHPQGRMLLVDARTLRQPGGTGDDWRLPLASDFTAGRMGQVVVTDAHRGATLAHYRLQPGDIVGADNGYGYRRSVAAAVQQQAHVGLRITPTTFPRATAAGHPFAVRRWLRPPEGTPREWHGWCHWDGQPYRVRLVAAKLPPEAAAAARRRKRRTAPKPGRTPTATTVRLAEWGLVVTTLEAADWPLREVLRLYRARWQVEEYHKCLKTGCAIEKRQLTTSGGLLALLGFLALTAVRLLQLRGLARTNPEGPADEAGVEPLFLRLVAARLNRDPASLTIAQFWRGVAMLGGFIGRKGDGEPGWQTLWDGWRRLQDMEWGAQWMETQQQKCG